MACCSLCARSMHLDIAKPFIVGSRQNFDSRMTPFGFFATAGGLTAICWLKSRHHKMGMSENEFWAAMWLMVAGGVIGAKALFVALGWRHYADGELRFWRDFG